VVTGAISFDGQFADGARPQQPEALQRQNQRSVRAGDFQTDPCFLIGRVGGSEGGSDRAGLIRHACGVDRDPEDGRGAQSGALASEASTEASVISTPSQSRNRNMAMPEGAAEPPSARIRP